MGPMTSKFLLHYLREGAPSEQVPYPPGQAAVSPLFEGGHEYWITAIHGISSVFNG